MRYYITTYFFVVFLRSTRLCHHIGCAAVIDFMASLAGLQKDCKKIIEIILINNLLAKGHYLVRSNR